MSMNPVSAGAGSLFARDPRTARRHAAEARFRALWHGRGAGGVAALLLLLGCAVLGSGAFWQTRIHIPVMLAESALDPRGRATRRR